MNSQEYWKQREEENLKHQIKDENEYDKELKQIYTEMLDGIQRVIDAFYGKYARQNGISLADAKKAVSKADMRTLERKAKRYVREKDFSKEANEEMRLYNLTMKVNRLEMLKANIGLELIDGHDKLQKFMGRILKGRTYAELQRQAGILGKTIKNNAQLANAIVNASFKNADFSSRIWMYQDMMKNDLAKMLKQGLIQGKGARELAKDLRKYVLGDAQTLKNGKNGMIYHTERLMRTELARVQTEAQKQSFERNGFKKYVFIVNGGCCSICEEAAKKNDGVYDVGKMMVGENAPPMHPYCRCSTAAYEDSDEYEAWLDFLASGGSTMEWNAWKNAQIKEESLRTKSGGKHGVNWKVVKSKEYGKRIGSVIKNEAANALATQRCKNALTNRSGKNTEEIYAISLTTGKDVSSITNQHTPFGVNRTEKFMADVQRAEKNNEKILFIHNHPNGKPPSIADLNELLDHKDAVGIAAGHNGSLYYYTKPSKKITNFDLSIAMRKTKKYNGVRAEEKTIEELARQFGFEFKIL